MQPGGARANRERRRADSVWIGCAIPRPVFEELTRQEKETGVYRTRIIAGLIAQALIGAVEDKELRAPPSREADPP